jgi:hypothetical protein
LVLFRFRNTFKVVNREFRELCKRGCQGKQIGSGAMPPREWVISDKEASTKEHYDSE